MKCRAFTLIEVLASMAVLMILTLALSRMFLSAADISSRGMTAITRNTVAETAMNAILSDLDCMVVNERLACFKVINTVEEDYAGFDSIYFIGTNGDPDDDMPYQYFHYYVEPKTLTNSLGAVYVRYDLMMSRQIMAVGAKHNFFALREGDTKWWEEYDYLTGVEVDVLAENVVAFDFYCQDWLNGDNLPDKTRFKTKSGTFEGYSSIQEVTVKNKQGSETHVRNIPPVSFDVKLKVTSPEAAVEGGMLIAAGGPENIRRGWELLNREATTLVGRAMPMMGPSQYRLQRRSGHNPVSHYFSDSDN